MGIVRFCIIVAVVMTAGCARGGASGADEATELAADGLAYLKGQGCLACHSLDGTHHVGPSLAGLMGSRRTVVSNGTRRDIVADADYVARSVREPAADLVEGFAPGSMPAYQLDDNDASAFLAALAHVDAAPPDSQDGGKSMLILVVLSALGFTGLHLLLSFGPIRSRLVSKLGEKTFQATYSVIALATFAGMVFGWLEAPYTLLWRSPGWAAFVPIVLLPIASIFLVAGFTTQNPAIAGQAGTLEERTEPYGIVRVSRHPALWGFALWALAHVLPNGDLSSLFLFGSIAALAILGMLHIDARRRAAMGASWDRFRAQTSLVPFVAIVTGRTPLRMSEIGVARIVAGLGLYAFYLAAHTSMFGVSPYPY
jgi:uncharacterized membrane protein